MTSLRFLFYFFFLLLISGCSISTFGKYQAEKGIPTFIQTGQTTRSEVLQKLGEPLVHRTVNGQETMIYNSEKGTFYFLYGEYEGFELVIRYDGEVVKQVAAEKTGSGWGFFAPATSNNPGTRRSAR